jgi:hypothetical protein
MRLTSLYPFRELRCCNVRRVSQEVVGDDYLGLVDDDDVFVGTLRVGLVDNFVDGRCHYYLGELMVCDE